MRACGATFNDVSDAGANGHRGTPRWQCGFALEARSRIVIADPSVRTLASVPRRPGREMHHDDPQVLWRQRSRGERVQLGQGNGGREQALDARLATAGVL